MGGGFVSGVVGPKAAWVASSSTSIGGIVVSIS